MLGNFRDGRSRRQKYDRKTISLDRVPLTLVPFYRLYLLDMQNSRSDPALSPCHSPKQASDVLTISSFSARIPAPSKIQLDKSVPKRIQENLLAHLPAKVSPKKLRKALENGDARKAEQVWVDKNFPKVRQPEPLCSCVFPLKSEEELKRAGRVIGREVTPQQFILSFHETKGRNYSLMKGWDVVRNLKAP